MSMYGPHRKIVAVGPHEADGTIVTMECGHTWRLVPHMHMDAKEIGQPHPCSDCKPPSCSCVSAADHIAHLERER
jgi:hypothetical protein